MKKEFFTKNAYAPIMAAAVIGIIVILIIKFSAHSKNALTETTLPETLALKAESSIFSYDCTVSGAPILYYFTFEQAGKHMVAITESLGTGCPDKDMLEKNQSREGEQIEFSEMGKKVTRENGDTYSVQMILQQ